MTLTAVTVEMPVQGRWSEVLRIGPDDLPGTLSSDDPDGRRMYLFGWAPGWDRPGVWESVGGADTGDAAPNRVLAVVGGLRVLSDLATPFELTITRAGYPTPRRVRFALSPGPA